MENVIITIKRSVFPLNRFYFTIGDNNYSISSGEIKKIKLHKEGIYEIVASSYWINKKEQLFLKNQSILYIKHIIPDVYYLVGAPIGIFLSILSFLGQLDVLVLSVVVFSYFLPITYFTLLKPNSYFKIKVEE